MIFLELVLQNFGPYAGKQIINLNPQIDEDNTRPIILLGGMNGGGKTTLIDAIRLALYGQRAQCSTRGNLSYSDFLTQCVNSKANPTEKTRIELVFEHIEEDKLIKYRVVRTWEKNPKDGKDHLGILGDDETWPIDSLVNIWDEYIENILPLGISNLFLFDGEQVKELAEQEIPPPIVVDAINGLLGLELADKLAIDLEILVNRKKREFADTKDLAKLEEIETRLQEKQEEYKKNNLKLINLNIEVTELEKIHEEALDRFVNEGGKIAAERSQLEQQREEKIKVANNLRESLREIAADVLPLALISPLLSQVQRQGEKELKTQQIQLAKDVLIARDERLLNWLKQLNLETNKLTNIQSFLAEDINNLYSNNLSTENTWLNADEESLSLVDNITYRLKISQNTAQKQLDELTNNEEDILTLDRQVQTAAAPEEYTKLQKAVKQTQTEFNKMKSQSEIMNQKLIELDAETKKLKQELNEYTVENLKYQNSEHIINSAGKVQQTLKIFRERLTLKKLNKLEEEVKNCFLYLLHKSNLVHRIAIDSKTFGLSLYDLNGKPVPKHRLSAGEKQLLAIAFLWGLAKVSGRRLPIAIDTPLGRLDSSHRNNLVERYFPSASHQVILLSTDTEIAKKEYQTLQETEAIAREYLLQYNSNKRETTIKPGYFW
ncbi:MAG: DNA sulfur modification protein DndD [Anabaena sp. CoA2_C59]|jgi:DNA sulfur modification protein DndD|uniref:Nuclease SbcCD subunit C n=1 Tax=Aphanizomenon flos-aquae WA102 TaxID=1710896 RepID=A0A1B7X5Y4_APHFL|nr:DNA sulfur modification protein DndD [Aphanizomenon flos-aquae Clear-A1]MBO1060912.1 DNA sulfur modification protein DndD [Aphanizomenon flos-aquae CP01]MCE2906970.1 DNA sulfur modification protein DndD [Anabaena sp. CoA2_C59]MDJ0503909.1 DNA sulfur modification protein DndD [Nostocales cyanobacterium LE14-WE12]OBQ21180.1 MAG: DNA sulfur modification protein DndD [Anabaena sp. WA113]OBQ29542.1 MAG: DNA sulfur modification protein DndD [Aphanizomenon flos-aquae MDT14a]OBQ44764.1 MAG: DNA su